MRKKKQPTADMLRTQLALAADEIIRLRESMEWAQSQAKLAWRPGLSPASPLLVRLASWVIWKADDRQTVFLPDPTLPPLRPWWRRLLAWVEDKGRLLCP